MAIKTEYRNCWCSNYDSCLGAAALKDERVLPCSGCRNEHDEGGKLDSWDHDPNELQAIYKLLTEIFFET